LVSDAAADVHIVKKRMGPMTKRWFSMVVVVSALAACDRDAAQVTAPERVALRKSAPVLLATATGSVQVSLYGYTDKYSFFAVSKNGATTGFFRWSSVTPAGEVWQGSGRIICMRVDNNNIAHLGAEFQPDDIPWAPPPFNYASFTVWDNDRNPVETPDYASLFAYYQTREQVLAHCAAGQYVAGVVDRGEVLVYSQLVQTGGHGGNDDDDD
jgi:hypothetical protein